MEKENRNLLVNQELLEMAEVILGNFKYDNKDAGDPMPSGYVAIPPGHPLWGFRDIDLQYSEDLKGRLPFKIDYAMPMQSFVNDIPDFKPMTEKGEKIIAQETNEWWVLGFDELDIDHVFIDLDQAYCMLRQTEDLRDWLAGGKDKYLSCITTPEIVQVLNKIQEDIDYYKRNNIFGSIFDARAENDKIFVETWNENFVERVEEFECRNYSEFLEKWIPVVFSELKTTAIDAKYRNNDKLVEINSSRKFVSIKDENYGYERNFVGEDADRIVYDITKLCDRYNYVKRDDCIDVYTRALMKDGLPDSAYAVAEAKLAQLHAGAERTSANMIFYNVLAKEHNPINPKNPWVQIKTIVFTDWKFSNEAEMLHVAEKSVKEAQDFLSSFPDGHDKEIAMHKFNIDKNRFCDVAVEIGIGEWKLSDKNNKSVEDSCFLLDNSYNMKICPYAVNISAIVGGIVKNVWVEQAREAEAFPVVFPNGDKLSILVDGYKGNRGEVALGWKNPLNDARFIEIAKQEAYFDKPISWHVACLKDRVMEENPGLRHVRGTEYNKGLSL